jgi:hypothetical protein
MVNILSSGPGQWLGASALGGLGPGAPGRGAGRGAGRGLSRQDVRECGRTRYLFWPPPRALSRDGFGDRNVALAAREIETLNVARPSQQLAGSVRKAGWLFVRLVEDRSQCSSRSAIYLWTNINHEPRNISRLSWSCKPGLVRLRQTPEPQASGLFRRQIDEGSASNWKTSGHRRSANT